MTYDSLIALIGFAFTSSVTPGPNNLMLMASGANFGLRRTLPHMAGISLGHGFMVLCVGAGLAHVFDLVPQLKIALKLVSVVYLLWLAWKIATAAPITPGQASGKPFTFFQAAAFQWVNPKAWAMALGAVTLYGDGSAQGAAKVAGVFICCNIPAITIWAVMGTQVAKLLREARHMRVFNGIMAALLVASLVVVV